MIDSNELGFDSDSWAAGADRSVATLSLSHFAQKLQYKRRALAPPPPNHSSLSHNTDRQAATRHECTAEKFQYFSSSRTRVGDISTLSTPGKFCQHTAPMSVKIART